MFIFLGTAKERQSEKSYHSPGSCGPSNLQFCWKILSGNAQTVPRKSMFRTYGLRNKNPWKRDKNTNGSPVLHLPWSPAAEILLELNQPTPDDYELVWMSQDVLLMIGHLTQNNGDLYTFNFSHQPWPNCQDVVPCTLPWIFLFLTGIENRRHKKYMFTSCCHNWPKNELAFVFK